VAQDVAVIVPVAVPVAAVRRGRMAIAPIRITPAIRIVRAARIMDLARPAIRCTKVRRAGRATAITITTTVTTTIAIAAAGRRVRRAEKKTAGPARRFSCS